MTCGTPLLWRGVPDPADHQVASIAEFEPMVAKLKGAGYEGLGVGGPSPASRWAPSSELYRAPTREHTT